LSIPDPDYENDGGERETGAAAILVAAILFIIVIAGVNGQWIVHGIRFGLL
jgi:hypothetical protein